METEGVHFRIQSHHYNHLTRLIIVFNVYWLCFYLVETVKLSKVNMFFDPVSGRKPFLGDILLPTNVARPVCAIIFRYTLDDDTELTN